MPDIEQHDDSKSSVIIDGMRFNANLYDGGVIRSALQYHAQPDDIFIVTPPRSGTTWMQTIVYALLNNGRGFDDDIHHYISCNPFLEMHGKDAVERMTRSGAIKTHLLFDRVPSHPKAKYICVLRNPKDVCVSLYRFITSINGGRHHCDITFNQFFDGFLAGQIGTVDYFDHLQSYWAHKDDANVLLVLYEDMKKDIRTVIRRIGKFLDIDLKDELLERIVTVTSFDYLKKADFNQKIMPAHKVATFQFIRKGIVGDWRTTLSKEQSRLLDERFQEKTKDIPQLNTLWKEYNV